jgi:hypothetical protein
VIKKGLSTSFSNLAAAQCTPVFGMPTLGYMLDCLLEFWEFLEIYVKFLEACWKAGGLTSWRSSGSRSRIVFAVRYRMWWSKLGAVLGLLSSYHLKEMEAILSYRTSQRSQPSDMSQSRTYSSQPNYCLILNAILSPCTGL